MAKYIARFTASFDLSIAAPTMADAHQAVATMIDTLTPPAIMENGQGICIQCNSLDLDPKSTEAYRKAAAVTKALNAIRKREDYGPSYTVTQDEVTEALRQAELLPC